MLTGGDGRIPEQVETDCGWEDMEGDGPRGAGIKSSGWLSLGR